MPVCLFLAQYSVLFNQVRKVNSQFAEFAIPPRLVLEARA